MTYSLGFCRDWGPEGHVLNIAGEAMIQICNKKLAPHPNTNDMEEF